MLQRYSPFANVSATASAGADPNGHYYLASEVDAYIAELEALCESLQNRLASRPLSNEDAQARIEEVEKVLRVIMTGNEGESWLDEEAPEELESLGYNTLHL